MRIAFVMDTYGVFRFLKNVVRDLYNRGHEIIIVAPASSAEDESYAFFLSEISDYEYEKFIPRSSPIWSRIAMVRYVLNFSNFLRPKHPTCFKAFYVRSLLKKMPLPVQILFRNPFTRTLLSKDRVRRVLFGVENFIPPDPIILDWLKNKKIDAVIASPLINYKSPDLEYVKAAQAAGIPTAAVIRSWDNLTTKGTFHVVPDTVLVWNQVMVDETVSLHPVSREKIVVTGAPVFDFWFSEKPLDRKDFCLKAGLNPSVPYIVYVGGSPATGTYEIPTVRELSKCLRQDPRTKNMKILLRPHPSRVALWSDFSEENVVIWPKKVTFPDTLSAQSDFYNSLAHSIAVVGMNTTAIIEAAIADKPTVMILQEHTRAVQTDCGHFKNFLSSGYLELARDMLECVNTLHEIAQGEDKKAQNRRKFVKDFVRPLGIDKSPAFIMADVIDELCCKQHKMNTERLSSIP